jgi:predicted nucleic acid-binding protein
MGARSFLDTNVLIYTDDHDSPEKQATASELFESVRLDKSGTVSTQVLQEYFAAVTRKLDVPAVVARRKIELFARLNLVVIDIPDVLAAVDLHRLYQFSIWDALIIRAAQLANCAVLYTEDLQHGQRIDGLEIVNPFLSG